MEIQNLTIRKAHAEDISILCALIKEFALYEKRPQDMTATKEQLRHWLFERKIASVLLAEYNGDAIGYALYYPVFGSFSATGKVHLEDIFIRQKFRGLGVGKRLLAKAAESILADGYEEMEWSCLVWNKPSLAFYKKLGAQEDTGRRYLRLDKSALETIAPQFRKDAETEASASAACGTPDSSI